MKLAKEKRLVCFTVIMTILAFVITGCPQNQPPEIPPESSLVMDFSDFNNSNSKKTSPEGDSQADVTATKLNWGLAVTNIFIWNVALTVTLVIPVAAFHESFNHTPVQQEDGTWVWPYNFTVWGVLYSAELHANTDAGGDTTWEMYISKEGGYTDFLWFSGVSNLPLTEGTWTLNHDPNDPTPYIGVEWHRDLSVGTADIKYTNIVPGGSENGGYIFYGITTDTPYDAFYDIYNKGQDNHTDIEWNTTTLEGHVKDPRIFLDNDWHCWNSDLEDIICP